MHVAILRHICAPPHLRMNASLVDAASLNFALHRSRGQRVGPEWPLVKVAKIARPSLPVSVPVRDFFELVTRFVEERIGLGSALHRARLAAIWPRSELVAHNVE